MHIRLFHCPRTILFSLTTGSICYAVVPNEASPVSLWPLLTLNVIAGFYQNRTMTMTMLYSQRSSVSLTYSHKFPREAHVVRGNIGIHACVKYFIRDIFILILKALIRSNINFIHHVPKIHETKHTHTTPFTPSTHWSTPFFYTEYFLHNRYFNQFSSICICSDYFVLLLSFDLSLAKIVNQCPW